MEESQVSDQASTLMAEQRKIAELWDQYEAATSAHPCEPVSFGCV